MFVLLHSQKHVSKLGDKLFPYKETEHCWQVSSDSKNVESIQSGNSKFTVHLQLITGTDQKLKGQQ